jgi:hypothetical protein
MENKKNQNIVFGSIKGKVYLKQSSIKGTIKVSNSNETPKQNILKYTLSEN